MCIKYNEIQIVHENEIEKLKKPLLFIAHYDITLLIIQLFRFVSWAFECEDKDFLDFKEEKLAEKVELGEILQEKLFSDWTLRMTSNHFTFRKPDVLRSKESSRKSLGYLRNDQ